MTDVKGFFYPRTAEGRSSIIPDPPWFYSGDLLTVEYRTDPERVAELLPGPAGARAGGPRRGRTDLGRLAVVLQQPRGAARPGALAVQGGVRRRPVQLRGPDVLPLRLHLGRQGLRHRPRHAPGLSEEARLDVADPTAPVRPRAPQIAAGGVFGATLAAGDRRIAEAVLTLREETETNGFVNAHPMAHHRVYPGIERGAPGRLRRADLVGCRRVRGRAAPGRVTSTCGSSSRRPRSCAPRGGRGHRRLLPPGRRQMGRRRLAGARTTRPLGLADRGGPAHEHDRRRGCRGRHPALDQRRAGRVAPHLHRRLADRRDGAGRDLGRGSRRGRPGSRGRPGGLPGLGGAPGRRALRDPARGRRRDRRARRGALAGRDAGQRVAAALAPPRRDAPRRA